jgi:hypothetical protein
MAYKNENAPRWKLTAGERDQLNRFLDKSTEEVFSHGPVAVYRMKEYQEGEEGL